MFSFPLRAKMGGSSLKIALGCVTLLTPAAGASAQNIGANASAAAPISEEVRLEMIGYKLAAGSADLCAKPVMLTGLMLHDISAYAPNSRPRAAKTFGLTYGFGVRQLVPGGVGEHTGLKQNDEIVAIGSTDLKSFSNDLIGNASSYDRTERFVAQLDDALRAGPVSLTVRRGEATMTLTLAGQPGCGGRLVLTQSSSLNAWADGKYVAVTTKMMRYAKDDQELAFVVAHEMSHNILRHDEHTGPSGLFAEFGFGAKKVKADEVAADGYAIGLMARAGFDLSAPERFLRRSGKARWMDLATTHPGTGRRVAIVNAAIRKLDVGQVQLAASSLAPVAQGVAAITLPDLGAATKSGWRASMDSLAAIALPSNVDLRFALNAPGPVNSGVPLPGIAANFIGDFNVTGAVSIPGGHVAAGSTKFVRVDFGRNDIASYMPAPDAGQIRDIIDHDAGGYRMRRPVVAVVATLI